jgi:hypothetical protein
MPPPSPRMSPPARGRGEATTGECARGERADCALGQGEARRRSRPSASRPRPAPPAPALACACACACLAALLLSRCCLRMRRFCSWPNLPDSAACARSWEELQGPRCS